MTAPDRESLAAAIHAAMCSEPGCLATSEAERIADALLAGPLAPASYTPENTALNNPDPLPSLDDLLAEASSALSSNAEGNS